MPSDQCRHNFDTEKTNDFGWRLQCEGDLFASISFDAPFGHDCESLIGERCHEHHVFGSPHDSYESPDVMACCGPYDPSFEDQYFLFCELDILQQVCISIAKRLEKMVEDGTFGPYAGQGAKLQQFIATHYVECFETLLANDTAPESGKIISSFPVEDSPKWKDIENFVITIDDGTSVTGVVQPGDPDEWLMCQSALDNNDEIFESAPPPSGGGVVHGVDLDAGVLGALVGPELFGGQVRASVRFDRSCAAKGCSSAVFWQDMTGRLVVQDVTLFADSFTVDNGEGMSMKVDSARVALYEQASTTPQFGEGFVVDPGEAFFLLSGSAGNVHDHYLAHNSSEIRISQSGGLWVIEPFSIEYVDESGARWSLSLSGSRWR